ncbi:MAG: Rieske 2Fe-2S domain-containing protein [Candidatus Nitrosocaldaceae archaeon]
MIKVCNINDIKDNSMILVCIEKREIIIGKKDGRIVAFDPFCPHRHAYLHRGSFKDCNIVCPLHEFEFNLDTGKLVSIPAFYNEQREEWKKSGDLILYKTTIKDNCVYVDLKSLDREDEVSS